MNGDLLLEYLEQIITGILGTVDSTDWLDDAASTAALQQIYNLLDQFGLEVADVLPLEMIQSYFGGVDEATAALVEAGDDIAPTMAVTDQGLIAAPFQKVIHTNAVEQLVDDSMMDMSAAIATAKASAAASIGTTLAAVKSDIAKGMITGDPWKVTQQAVMESFLKDGMTAFQVEDKNGVVRNLPLRFYAMTVVRTKNREATVQGSVNRYTDAGHDLTQITGNGDSCEVCARYNGLVVSMTGKTPGYPAVGENGIRLGPYHPNCRCGHRVFIVKFATDEEVKAAKARNKKYKPTGDPRTKEEREAYEEEQRKRRIANAEAKQFARWESVLGAEAPKTIGAFRAMKRKNSPKFQELQSAFLSATHTKTQNIE